MSVPSQIFSAYFSSLFSMAYIIAYAVASTFTYGSAYAGAYAVVSYAEVAYNVAYDFLELNIGVFLCFIWQLGLKVFSVLFLSRFYSNI